MQAPAPPRSTRRAATTASPGRRQSLARLGLTRLTAKIVGFNLIALALIYILVLSFADFRRTLADTTLDALLTQSDVMVGAIQAENAVFDIAAQPTSRSAPPTALNFDVLDDLMERQLVGSSSRVQVYDVDGNRLVDSALSDRSTASVADDRGVLGRFWDAFAGLFVRASSPTEVTRAVSPELLAQAADGRKVSEAVLLSGADLVLVVAAPLRRDMGDGDVAGVLTVQNASGMISREARELELKVALAFLVAGIAIVGSGILVTAWIARPLVQLADATDMIARGAYDTRIPTTDQPGQVGQLSRAIEDMTQALTTRIDAIESFAGEVAHELKNPLTSLRSAVETLPLAKTDKSRERLLEVIAHDVQRIDRLITDISDASKLDAELNRFGYETLDLIQLLNMVVGAQNEIAHDRNQRVTLGTRDFENSDDFFVLGNEGRLSQVFVNLIDNARSFTPDDGAVTVTATRFPNFIEVVVDDEGPGIAENMLERIFERFYTDRSEQSSFGNNSGLGLAISRQIIEAHGGELFAENRYRTSLGPDRDLRGARFTVRLPPVT